ncbi:MAG TPA: MBL fold metallo-hydrolase [Candidatus Binatia bacterium]|jgi:L-ascorbate metabolism protein UlaG (beta-lactamase superfamily)|nr:MBL fold metallo-hydrolase [Candidatus Binatia bacterium]
MRRVLAAVLLALGAGCSTIPIAKTSAFHGSDANIGITRIVHGAVIVEIRGTRVLIDPWFHSDIALRQREALGITPERVPDLPAVLLTDDDVDHLDDDSLALLAKRVPRIVVPVALRDRVAGLGFGEVIALGAWEHTTIDDVTVTAVPSRVGARETGWVLAKDDEQVYVAPARTGTTALVDIATAFPSLDVALLPIGGRRVMGALREMDPDEAAQAAATLKPATIIPIGYGAEGVPPFVWYPSDPVTTFRDDLKARGLAGRLIVLQSGESWHRYQ